MKNLILILFFMSSVTLHAKDQSVEGCTKELTRVSFDLKESKAKDLCRKYSQKAIDCGIELKRVKSMTHTLESAIEDCARERDEK